MLDRQWMIDREDRRDREARRFRYIEFAVAVIGVALIVVAAFIERGGQPTINTSEPNINVIVPSQPTPDTGASQPEGVSP